MFFYVFLIDFKVMKRIKYKYFCFVILLLLNTINLWAIEPDLNVIKKVAVNFFSNINSSENNLNRTQILDIVEHKYDSILCYYTINFIDGGYVNVAASYASIPVLSYSLDGRIDNDTDYLSPAYQDWMNTYKIKIYEAIISKADYKVTIEKWHSLLENNCDKTKTRSTVVGPLTTSKWGQSYTNDFSCPGYNSFADVSASCPCGHCAIGCVAIAMAQIMYYWKHPLNKGFYNYYDWCFMKDELNYDYGYNPTFENEQKAISKLAYDCAESVNMNYCSDGCGSGASTSDVVNALIYSYKYHNDAEYLNKSSFSVSEWKDLIKSDIDNNQPIIYRGEGSEGHAFICDGYDESSDGDFFHFNFGWNGSFEQDWFTLDDITPGSGNFTSDQAAIFHIKPEPSTFIDYCEVGVNLYNLYYSYYSAGGTSSPWEIVPETMQYLISSSSSVPNALNTIPNGITANYIAHNRVVLQEGFKAESGSNFLVKIEPCVNCDTENKMVDNRQELLLEEESINDSIREDNLQISNDMEAENRIKIYPNPSNGNFSIFVSDNINPSYSIIVTDIFGKIVFNRKDFNKNKTDVTIKCNNNGIYFVKIESKDYCFVKKVLINY